MAGGRLITVEGLDGAGKTTLVAGLARELGAVALREPGGVHVAEHIRDLVKAEACTPRTEALLFAAARAELVERELRPRLARGETVVLDRFVDSSLAYQGGGRGLGVDAVRAVNAFATGGLEADHRLLLRLDAAEGLARVGGRGTADRFEDLAFLRAVAATYDALVADDPGGWTVLDATRAPEDVLAAALQALRR